MPSKVWDEITYQFPNFSGCIAEVREWIPHIMMNVITTGAGVASVALSSSLPALEVVISTTYGAASDESALRVATFPLQRASIHDSDNGAMCAGRITVRSAQSHCDFSLCVVPFSLLSFCMLLLFYVTFMYFMLSMSDNSPCGYCYLLTIPDVK